MSRVWVIEILFQREDGNFHPEAIFLQNASLVHSLAGRRSLSGSSRGFLGPAVLAGEQICL